jgi:hypothetical protein
MRIQWAPFNAKGESMKKADSGDEAAEPDAEREHGREGYVEVAANGEGVGIVGGEKIVAGCVGNMQRDCDGKGDPRQGEVPVQRRGRRELEHACVPLARKCTPKMRVGNVDFGFAVARLD